MPNPTSDRWTILCDFDGTVVPLDVTDALLGAFAAPEWTEIEQQWIDGRITAHQCMEQQIRLLQVDPVRLDAFLDSLSLTPGLPEFVAWCRARGVDLQIVSDGLDYAIHRILKNHGLDDIPVTANRLRFDPNGYHLDFPHEQPDCPSGVCKCACAAAMTQKGGAEKKGSVLLIGDGLSDCCVAAKVDFVLAKTGQTLHKQCRNGDYPHQTYETFFDVCAILDSTGLLSGTTPAYESYSPLCPERPSSHVH